MFLPWRFLYPPAAVGPIHQEMPHDMFSVNFFLPLWFVGIRDVESTLRLGWVGLGCIWSGFWALSMFGESVRWGGGRLLVFGLVSGDGFFFWRLFWRPEF